MLFWIILVIHFMFDERKLKAGHITGVIYPMSENWCLNPIYHKLNKNYDCHFYVLTESYIHTCISIFSIRSKDNILHSSLCVVTIV